MVLRVQHLMGNAPFFSACRKAFHCSLPIRCPTKTGCPRLGTHRFPRSPLPEFGLLRRHTTSFRSFLIIGILVGICTTERLYIFKFILFRLCRTCHTRQFFVHAEEILERNRRQRLGLPLYLYTLLSLNSLMQSVGIAPPLPSGVR